jgi:predicted DNA-binding protein (MmcQ/YjbR family)
MDIETLREYCLSKKGAAECLPFGDDALVFKVMGRMFALLILGDRVSINLKCEPEKAIELREQYPSVIPGYHMNKMHWNTIIINGSVPENLVYQWITESYRLVAEGLPNKLRKKLGE